jgi:hypothetical protein
MAMVLSLGFAGAAQPGGATTAGANTAELPVVALVCTERNELPWVDLAETALAADPRIRLVDREHLRKVLEEQKLAALMGPADGAKRVQIGRLVGCDLLIIVRQDPSPQKVVRVVIADTRTGIRLVTAELSAKHAAQMRQLPPALLTTALEKRAVAQPIVLAIPPFANDDLSRSNQFLQSSLATVCEAVAAHYPQILLVELEEARELAKENSLTGRETSRALPYYLPGRFRLESANAERPPQATLRLDRGNTLIAELKLDSPTPENIGAFVQSAAAELLSSLAVKKGDTEADDAGDAAKLAARATEFMKVGDFEQGVRLAEASLLLRPDQLELRHTARNVYKDLAGMQYDDPRMDAERFERQFQKALFFAERNLEHMRIYLAGINTRYSGNPEGVNIYAFDRHNGRKNPAVHAAIVKHHRDYRQMLVESIELKAKRGEPSGDMRSLLVAALGYYHQEDDGTQKEYLTKRLGLLRIVEGTPQQRRWFYKDILTWGIASPDADTLALYESFFDASDPELVAAAKTAKEEGEYRTGIRKRVVPAVTPEPPPLARSDISVRITPVEFGYVQDGRQAPVQFQGILADERGHEVVWGVQGSSGYYGASEFTGRDGLRGPRVVLHHQGGDPFRKIFETDEGQNFGHGCYDGRYFWLPVSGTAGQVLRIDPADGTVERIGAEQGLPDVRSRFVAAITAPLEPGRIVLVASFGQQDVMRTFLAEIACRDSGPSRVRIVHEAREQPVESDRRARLETEKTNPNIAYWPKFVLPLREHGSETPARVLIPRRVNGSTAQSNSLVVDLATGKAEILGAVGQSQCTRDDVAFHDGAAYWVTNNRVWQISAEYPPQQQALARVQEYHGALFFTQEGILLIGVECWFTEDWSKPFRKVPDNSEKFFQSYVNSSHSSSHLGSLLKANEPGNISGGERKVYRIEVIRNADAAK